LIYILAAIAGFLFLHRRLLGVCIWLGVAASGVAGLTAGQPAGIVLVGLGLTVAVIAGLKPNPAPIKVPRSLAPDDESPLPVATEPTHRDTGDTQPAAPPVDVTIDAPAAPEPLLNESAASIVPAAAPKLQIRAIGILDIRSGDQELAKAFRRRKLMAFVWLHLLTRALHSPGQRLGRTALAAELSTNLEPAAQRDKLRSQIHDLQHNLPAALVRPLLIDSDSLAFDLDACELDVIELRRLDAVCRDAGDLLPAELQREVEAMLLTLAPGEYLPGWEDVEHQITEGKGVAGSTVRSVRQQVDGWRANLAGSLAISHLARREPARAIPLLQDAVERCPEREDLARHLIAAYLETGQPGRAAELRREYQIPQEA
jgi:hypothetical protein